MRLWSLHPRHLDRRALVACWREGLLAQAVLRGRTKGYKHHSQLERFRATGSPVAAVAAYLRDLADEAERRGYRFDRTRIARTRGAVARMRVTRGQLAYEWTHLLAKVRVRDREWLPVLRAVAKPAAHPSFRPVAGDIETWERP